MPDMGKRFSHHTNRENPLTPQDSGGVRAAGLPAAVVALAEKMQCAAWAFAPRCIGHLSALRLPLHRTAWDSSF